MVVLRLLRAYAAGIKLSFHLNEPNFGSAGQKGGSFRCTAAATALAALAVASACVVPCPSRDIPLTSWSSMWSDSDYNPLAKYTVILQITQ